jgi:hypothetical protein
MRLSVLFQLTAAGFFVLSTVKKIQRPWMIPIGMALFALSFTPYFNQHVG